MPIKRLTVWSVAFAASFATSQLFAAIVAHSGDKVAGSVHDAVFAAAAAPALLSQLPNFDPAPILAQSAVPAGSLAQAASVSLVTADDENADDRDDSADDHSVDAVVTPANNTNTNALQKSLIAMAMKLRDIRYVSGGHDPSAGFDCSGFVRYVFAHAVGLDLPTNSASQFLAGLKVRRNDMQPGDLVFFRTAGRRGKGRISHVGIYVANGRFIHSPSHGKTVRVDSLGESYWAKRFAGAKRPEGMG